MAANLADPPETGTLSTAEERIEAWRFEQLVAAGYSPADAQALAKAHSGPNAVDLHEAIELVKKGADPHLAFEIIR